MAKENLIRKKAIETLTAGGWLSWWPVRVKFRNNDIFGAFDLISVRKNKIRFIQLTTLSNLSTRKKKVEKVLRKNRLKLASEIWGYSGKKGFKIVKIS